MKAMGLEYNEEHNAVICERQDNYKINSETIENYPCNHYDEHTCFNPKDEVLKIRQWNGACVDLVDENGNTNCDG
jgi:hypothetical protein